MKRCDFPLGPVCLKDGWVLVRGQPDLAGPGPTRPEGRGGVLMAFPPHQPRTCPCSRVCSSPDTTKELSPEKLWAVRTSPLALLHNWSLPFQDLPGVERNYDPWFRPLGWDRPPSSPRDPMDRQMARESIWAPPQAVSCCLWEVPPGLKEKIKPAPGSTCGTIKSLIKLNTFRSPC